MIGFREPYHELLATGAAEITQCITISRMEFIKKLKLKPVLILKGTIILVAGIFVLALIMQLVGTRLTTKSVGNYAESEAPAASFGRGASEGIAFDNVFAPSSLPPMDPVFSPGADAEDFEVTSYAAEYETRELSRVCTTIADLKALEYVIFETSNERDHRCDYSFKVTNERTDEVVTVLVNLDPKELNENTHTIKRSIEATISERAILQEKLAQIDETLSGAISSYDELGALATSTRDVESLTKIVDAKIRLIDRLSQSRLSVSAQLNRIVKAQADQNDRLQFTFFQVSVVENVFVDGEQLGDAWKAATRAFVRDANDVLLNVSINLVIFLLVVLQYLLYLFLLLIIAKYAWVAGRYLWKK